MIKALKGTPQEDNRVLSDPYNWGSLYPGIRRLSAPTAHRELLVRPFTVPTFLPFRRRAAPLPRDLRVERCLVVDGCTAQSLRVDSLPAAVWLCPRFEEIDRIPENKASYTADHSECA